jgi:hypothetical protein
MLVMCIVMISSGRISAVGSQHFKETPDRPAKAGSCCILNIADDFEDGTMAPYWTGYANCGTSVEGRQWQWEVDIGEI